MIGVSAVHEAPVRMTNCRGVGAFSEPEQGKGVHLAEEQRAPGAGAGERRTFEPPRAKALRGGEKPAGEGLDEAFATTLLGPQVRAD